MCQPELKFPSVVIVAIRSLTVFVSATTVVVVSALAIPAPMALPSTKTARVIHRLLRIRPMTLPPSFEDAEGAPAAPPHELVTSDPSSQRRACLGGASGQGALPLPGLGLRDCCRDLVRASRHLDRRCAPMLPTDIGRRRASPGLGGSGAARDDHRAASVLSRQWVTQSRSACSRKATSTQS
jgi:hypothetical protein